MIDNKKINESRFKKQQAISDLTLPRVDFRRTSIDDSDNSSRIKNTESRQNESDRKIKTSKTNEPRVQTIYFGEKSEDKSLNFENYIEGYQSNIFQKFFYWNNNDNCFIF